LIELISLNKLRLIVTGGRWLASSSISFLSFRSFHLPLHDVFEIGSSRQLLCAVLLHEVDE
jgi:hypothetical protein